MNTGMKRRSLILIVLIVLLPVGLLTWVGLRMARDEQSVTQQRFHSVMEQRLEDVNRIVASRFAETERRLQQITAIDIFDIASLRESVRTEPQVTQLFLLSPEGNLLYPNPGDSLNGTELSFLQKASRMFTDRDLQSAVALSEAGVQGDFSPFAGSIREAAPSETSADSSATPQMQSAAETRQAPAQPPSSAKPGSLQFLPSGGWFVWYWDRGLNLIYWQRRPSGHIVGAALERARWIADLISWLPETGSSSSGKSPSLVDTSFRVVSSSAEVVYEWGGEPLKDAPPFCELPVAAPLASWRIQCFVPSDQIAAGSGRSAFLGLIAGMGAFALTLTALAWLLYRDYSRDMREASQQVSFVNQVSHELKTPLTNIRLYAELLERDLEQVESEQSEKPRKRLEVITSEAQRLSRLIGNVLTFARQHRKTLKPHPVPVEVANLVRQIADRFTPSLNDHGIEVSLIAETGNSLWLDPDFVEQILGNLISNVEKYAGSGKSLSLRIESDNNEAIIDVVDAGPGITAAQRADVFRPFARLSSDLRSSTGTGIGLSIARELARLHGGDLILRDSARGCCFQVRLRSMNPAAETSL